MAQSRGNRREAAEARRGRGRQDAADTDAQRNGRNNPRKRKNRKARKIVIFIIEIVVLIVMVMFLYSTLMVERSGRVNINEEDIVINPLVREESEYAQTTLKGFRNIALFGVDSTTGQLDKNTRSDTIIIASVNLDTYEVRLVSVYRDTFMNLGNDSYNKCNAAYAQGGPEQAINMLNMNMDLNITDFVTVGFKGVTDTIDALGGIMVNVTEAEVSHLNNYQSTMATELKREYVAVTGPGLQKLNGLQATAYCRIRYTAGDDFRRAQRQRDVLQAILDEAKKASLSTLTSVANDVFSSVYTSLDLADIVSLLGDITRYQVVGDDGFPTETLRSTGTIGRYGSCVVPVDLEANTKWLHEFLFGGENYVPSEEVKAYSQKIKDETSPYLR